MEFIIRICYCIKSYTGLKDVCFVDCMLVLCTFPYVNCNSGAHIPSTTFCTVASNTCGLQYGTCLMYAPEAYNFEKDCAPLVYNVRGAFKF